MMKLTLHFQHHYLKGGKKIVLDDNRELKKKTKMSIANVCITGIILIK